MHPETKKLN